MQELNQRCGRLGSQYKLHFPILGSGSGISPRANGAQSDGHIWSLQYRNLAY